MVVFDRLGAHVVGVSFDSPEENRAFRDKEALPYPLWSDGDKALALHYGVIGTRMQPFASRVTVVLDDKGAVIARIPREGVEPPPQGHADAALDVLRGAR